MRPKAPLCGTCQLRVSAKGNPGLTCGSCERSDHFTCLKITDAKKNAILAGEESYLCSKCRSKQRLSLSIVATPTPTKEKNKSTAPAPDKQVSINSNNTDKSRQPILKPSASTATGVPADKTPTSNESLVSTLLATIQTLNETIKSLERKLQFAFDQINRLQQQPIQNNNKPQPNTSTKSDTTPKPRSFTINGIPEADSKEPKEVVKRILQTVDPSNELDPAVTIRKIPSKDKSRPPPILVSCTLSSKNFNTLNSLKRRRITGSDIGIENCENIFINESYPSQVYKLFKEAKRLRGYGYKFIWIKDNRILNRTAESAPVTQIESIDQLKQLISTLTADNANESEQN